MERVTKIENLVKKSADGLILWELLLAYVDEYLTTGFNSQITIDIQQGRISNVKRADWASGVTQSNYYLGKME